MAIILTEANAGALTKAFHTGLDSPVILCSSAQVADPDRFVSGEREEACSRAMAWMKCVQT